MLSITCARCVSIRNISMKKYVLISNLLAYGIAMPTVIMCNEDKPQSSPHEDNPDDCPYDEFDRLADNWEQQGHVPEPKLPPSQWNILARKIGVSLFLGIMACKQYAHTLWNQLTQ